MEINLLKEKLEKNEETLNEMKQRNIILEAELDQFGKQRFQSFVKELESNFQTKIMEQLSHIPIDITVEKIEINEEQLPTLGHDSGPLLRKMDFISKMITNFKEIFLNSKKKNDKNEKLNKKLKDLAIENQKLKADKKKQEGSLNELLKSFSRLVPLFIFQFFFANLNSFILFLNLFFNSLSIFLEFEKKSKSKKTSSNPNLNTPLQQMKKK